MKFCLYNVTTAIKQGGIETFYWEVAKELQDRGIKVELISGQGNFIKYPDIPLKQFDFTSRNKIIDLGNRFKKWGERISFFKNAYSYLKNQHYDFFLIHKPLDFFTAYFMKKINPNLKVIFISGGEDFYGFDKFFSKYIDYMFAVSRDNANIIKNRYKRDVQILHNGVNTELFRKDESIRIEYRKKYKLDNNRVLLSVGRIVGWKGYQLVIKAIRDLDVKYVLIGDGEYLNELKKLAKQEKVDDKVLFLGSVSNKELYKYLNMGDIFVQPSIGHEAFGITIVEAMACGLPVIASYNGGMKDIIVDGENGFFFEVNNIENLKEKIKNALNHKFKDVRQYVIDNFTWKKTVDKLLGQIKK
ncbi:glycosyltransferase family 4 protein [Nautilia lithotrophica]